MKDKIKFYFDDEERVLIVNSLTFLKQSLINQNISTDPVEEIISKVSDKSKLELDVMDSKIVIKALYDMRGELKKKNESYYNINDVLLKVINETDKKKTISKEDIGR